MYALFVKLVNMSLAAGLLILAIMILRLLLRKAPKWMICAMWAVVAVRLICPFSIPSRFSVYRYFDRELTESGDVAYFRYDGKTGSTMITFGVNAIFADNSAERENLSGILKQEEGYNLRINWPGIIKIWGAGSVLLLSYAVLSLIMLKRKLREAAPLRDNIWLCDNVKSPFILGIVRPRIYLSSSMEEFSSMGETQLKQVIAHETAHLRRKDHWWKLLGYLLLAVYWFNPLIWAAYILFCRDMEFACDEKVIRDYSHEDKKAYSNTLLSCSDQRRTVMFYPVAFGEIGVEQRIRNVLHYQKPTPWIIASAIVICAVVLTGFTTVPRGGDVSRLHRNIDAGSLYSEQEINEIMDIVVQYFEKEFNGCSLTELSYEEELSQRSCREWAEQYQADQAILFTSSFDVYASGGDGCFNPNSTYKKWQWVLTRKEGEKWKLQTWGY